MSAYGYCIHDYEANKTVAQCVEVVEARASQNGVVLDRIYTDTGSGVFLPWTDRPGLRLLARRLSHRDEIVTTNVFAFGFRILAVSDLFRRFMSRNVTIHEERGTFDCGSDDMRALVKFMSAKMLTLRGTNARSAWLEHNRCSHQQIVRAQKKLAADYGAIENL